VANEQYKAQKKSLQFSKKKIDKAGRDIRHSTSGDERVDAIQKIQNFREYHLYPLMLLKNHLARTARKVSKKIIVARRLKQLPTIINKLERPSLDGKIENSIKLTRMQDIAGCRAIVKDLKQLNALKARLLNSKSVHKVINLRDYLIPKSSGYGGIHLIYSCYEGQGHDSEWKKCKVEIQLRTELQHSWATSLEIIDTLEQISLKTSQDGNENWRRFFALSGKLVAHTEAACIIPDEELIDIKAELKGLVEKLKVISKLARFSLAINFSTDKKVNAKVKNGQGMFLISISFGTDTDEIKINASVKHFSPQNSGGAIEALNTAELDDDIPINVLVSAPDVRALKKAYPNYFGSTTKFSEFIKEQIKEV
jgi:ppGpp synthetase/RelA/SpoT-type nucleotidyltranferase